MKVRSLALTTELALAAMRGRVTDRGDYIVVETPDNPGYYDGNVLVLPAAPQVGEVTYWTRKFTAELGARPGIRHVSLWWDGVSGDQGAADELSAAGFSLQTNQVMVVEGSQPVRASEQPARYGEAPVLVPRTLTPDEVLATADLAYTLGDRHDDTYRLFLDRRAAWHRDLVATGKATFWGVFDADVLVASLGLVWLGDLARYQDVQTLPTHRKRGLASSLLVASLREAFARGVGRVVIIVEPESEGERVYARIGFRIVERTVNARRV